MQICLPPFKPDWHHVARNVPKMSGQPRVQIRRIWLDGEQLVIGLKIELAGISPEVAADPDSVTWRFVVNIAMGTVQNHPILS